MISAAIEREGASVVADSDSSGFRPGSCDARAVRVALLGCGTVGGATARMLSGSRRTWRESRGIDVVLTRVLVRDAARPRDGVDPALLTADFEDVLRDEPDVIVEALGGREPAATLVARALERGIHVVSANKTLIAHDGPRLEAIAQRSGARLAYEASVGAAVPILAALRQRGGEPVVRLQAVLNGTCNFILTRMAATGARLDAALRDAIALGLAEPDPSADVSGRDSAEKLCILARAAGFSSVTPGDVETCGIEAVTPRDVQAAREHGCVIRLVAELDAACGRARLSVGPAFVLLTHALAKARSAENVFVLDQEFGGRLVLHGEGAGPRPTAAAIAGDLLRILGGAKGTAAPVVRAPCDDDSARRERLFVRLPLDHAAASRLRASASQVHLRRDGVEVVVERAEVGEVGAAFAAVMVE